MTLAADQSGSRTAKPRAPALLGPLSILVTHVKPTRYHRIARSAEAQETFYSLRSLRYLNDAAPKSVLVSCPLPAIGASNPRRPNRSPCGSRHDRPCLHALLHSACQPDHSWTGLRRPPQPRIRNPCDRSACRVLRGAAGCGAACNFARINFSMAIDTTGHATPAGTRMNHVATAVEAPYWQRSQ